MRGTRYDMFHEKLRSHVTSYVDYLNSVYISGMIELEVLQIHFQICWLFSPLNDIPKPRYLLDVLEELEAWVGARGQAGLSVKRLAAICLI